MSGASDSRAPPAVASRRQRTIAWLFDGKHDGYFVDLAANDPILYSNTRTLERDYGWRGVCIDGNMAMLQKLVAQRTCTVVKGIVSRTSGAVVQFTNPEQSGTWEDAMGGILSNATDNSKVRPGYAAQKWRAVSETTVTLVDILDRVQSPSLVDYLSLECARRSSRAALHALLSRCPRLARHRAAA